MCVCVCKITASDSKAATVTLQSYCNVLFVSALYLQFAFICPVIPAIDCSLVYLCDLCYKRCRSAIVAVFGQAVQLNAAD